MADDPNRDLLPVRDGSYTETYRSIIGLPIDPRERHTVSKIDRDDLEDKYLRLLEEYQGLKKLSNSQEDKIKRLATKLIRVSATPRTYMSASMDTDTDKNRNDILKMENNKLKDKIAVMRNQILSHRVLRRSPSQTRRIICTSSRPTTCRSESGRLKTSTYQNFINDRDDDTVNESFINKIGELEEQRKEMIGRIAELENKLTLSQTGSQKDKIAENVEYIRVWRQMKLGHDKLMEAEAMKKALCSQIAEMKHLFDQTTKNNGQIAETLAADKKRLSEMDDEVTRVQENQLREKDEQIRDLISEIKILQQHNSELINLSTKYSQVKIENAELKKKLSESLADNHSIKSALNNEQTNTKALQAANEKLIEKLKSTQSHIDQLTIQFKSAQNQYLNACKMNSEVETKKKEIEKKIDKDTSTSTLLPIYDSIDTINKKDDNNSQRMDQTDHNEILESQHQLSSLNKQSRERVQPPTSDTEIQKYERNPPNNTVEHVKNGLSRDKMLKLLDDAQTNRPLNTQNAVSRKQIDNVSPKNYANTKYRQSSKSVHLTTSSSSSLSSSPPRRKLIYQDQKRHQDHNDVIKQICKILKNYYRTLFNEIDGESITIYRSNLPSTSDNSINIKQKLTDGQFIISSSSRDTCDQNNNDILSKIHNNNNNNNTLSESYNDNLKHISVQKWNFEEDILHNMTNIDNDFDKTAKCICDEIEQCCGDCVCKGTRKCETKIDLQPFLSTIDDINTSLQKAAYDNKISQPLSKTIQLETGLCCEPYDLMKDKYLENCSAEMEEEHMERHQVIASSKNSWECKESCSATNNKESNDVAYIVEKDDNTGCVIDTPDRYSPIVLTDLEGLVEIHILSVQFSPLLEDTLFNKNGTIIERLLSISCKFCGEQPISSSTIKYPDLKFNSSCIYRVPDLDKFFNNIAENPVYLQLHIVIYGNLSYVIAHGKIDVKDILIYPQNKIHYLVSMESLVPCFLKKKIAQLSLWIRLSCDINCIKSIKEQSTVGITDTIPAINCDNKNEKLSINSKPGYNKPMQPIVEMIHERRHTKVLNITTNKSDCVSNTSNAINNSGDLTHEKSVDIPEIITKLSSKELLTDPWKPWQPTNHVKEAHNSLQNMNLIPHEGDDSNSQEQTLFNDDIDDSNDAIVITIHRLKLMQGCPLLYHPDIHQLFVEFSFLGKSGREYETDSVSIPKSYTQNMHFKYEKKICIDEKKHSNERNYLRGILYGEKNPNVQFNIVSEPLVEEMETKECIDVGHAYLNLKKHVLGKGDSDVFLTVKNPENTDVIGVLKISIVGTNNIRQLLSKSTSITES